MSFVELFISWTLLLFFPPKTLIISSAKEEGENGYQLSNQQDLPQSENPIQPHREGFLFTDD